MSAEVLALIPARSGSKSIPDKNIRPVAGKPLLAHSIAHAQAAASVDRVIVSTDSAHYAAIARAHGAETPFLRPAAFAGDTSTDLETFVHALEWLQAHEHYVPEIVVHLRPTYPERDPAMIDEMVELLRRDPALDAVRTVAPAPATPYKMWTRGADGLLTAVAAYGEEAYNRPRQELPEAFLQNACIDVVRSAVIREQRSMTGRRIFGYVMADSLDIDTPAELERALAQMTGGGVGIGRTLCFDIDGVIATLVPDNDYTRAEPHRDVIAALNRLYDVGCRIVLQSARGSLTGRDWAQVTRQQMDDWGVRYHELLFGKPAADYYIDDRAIGLAELLRIAEILALHQPPK